MKICIIDVETTGLNWRQHEIIELACVIFDDQTFTILDSFDTKVVPRFPWHTDSEMKAYEVNGYSPDDWKDAVAVTTALTELRRRAKGSILCAYNLTFDLGFLSEASRKTCIPLPFDRPKIDLLSMAWARIPHAKLQNWSLRAVCTYLGIPPEPKVHRAMGGCMAEYAVYRKLMEV